ncbi:hypothetical protein [Haladaptatus sp. DJG-WS-42]|uniref:hypothetical protein n=1 Tax=Haladaptatus sp. DJG-WS-42 TaxID=3120516 RepID=UPI0030D082CF
MPSTRRKLLLGGFVALAGCLSGSDETEQPTEQTTTQTTSQTPATTTTKSTPTATSKPAVVRPDESRAFGEAYAFSGLEITVETPTISTTFEHDGATYTMPDESALLFAPLTFSNTADELRPIDGPVFTLLNDETTNRETHSVRHPEFDPSIRIREMDDVPTTGRWNAEGSAVEPDERLSGIAVFEVSETTKSTEVSIVFDSQFKETVVEWTAEGETDLRTSNTDP